MRFTPNYQKVAVFALTVPIVLVCGCDLCANEIYESIPSPDGTLKAVVFSRDCGATTGFSTQVSVLATGEGLPNESGNVFVEDNGDSVDVKWQGNRHLLIQAEPTVFRSEKRVRVRTGWNLTSGNIYEEVMISYEK